MHVSLDSALGRQRRLNSVGESVLQIAPNAAAAYSLRSLTGGDPKVVRVRRDTGGGAGDNDEQDFTASGISSGALVAFVGSGNDGFVETWYDQSGNSNDAVQATAADQPKIVLGGSLLTAGVTFDGTSDHLDLTNILGITSVCSNFIVTNLDSTGTNDILIDNSDSSSDGYRIKAASSNIGFDYANSLPANVARASGQAVYYFNKTSTKVQSGANGGTLVEITNSTTISISNKAVIGKNSFGFLSFLFEGPIQEIIIYASDQTANRSALETNIAAKYGITL